MGFETSIENSFGKYEYDKAQVSANLSDGYHIDYMIWFKLDAYYMLHIICSIELHSMESIPYDMGHTMLSI